MYYKFTPQRQTPNVSGWRNSTEYPYSTSVYSQTPKENISKSSIRSGAINLSRFPQKVSRINQGPEREETEGNIDSEFLGGVIPLDEQSKISKYTSPMPDSNLYTKEEIMGSSPIILAPRQNNQNMEGLSVGISQLAKYKNLVEKSKSGTIEIDTEKYNTKNFDYNFEMRKENIFQEEEKNNNTSYYTTAETLPFEIYSDLVSKGFNKTKKQGKLFNYVQHTYEPENYTDCYCVLEKEFPEGEKPKTIGQVVRPPKEIQRPRSLAKFPSNTFVSQGETPERDTQIDRSPQDKFRCISMAMIKSKGPNCENRKITRRTRGEKGGVVDFGLDDPNNQKYKVNDPKRHRIRYINTEINPKTKIKACKIIQKWWFNLKKPKKVDNTLELITRIQKMLRGYNVRKNLYKLFALALYYQNFSDTLHNAMSHCVKRTYFPLFSKKALIREALLKLLEGDHYVKKQHLSLWKDNAHKIGLRNNWLNALLARKGSQYDKMNEKEKHFNRWKANRDVDLDIKKANEALLQKVKGADFLVKGTDKVMKKKGMKKIGNPLKEELVNRQRKEKKKKLRPLIYRIDKRIDIEKYFNRWRLRRDIGKDIKKANDALLQQVKGIDTIIHGTYPFAQRKALEETKAPINLYLSDNMKKRRKKKLKPIITKKDSKPIDLEKFMNRWRSGKSFDKEKEDLINKIKGAEQMAKGAEKFAKKNSMFVTKNSFVNFLLDKILENRRRKILPIILSKELRYERIYLKEWMNQDERLKERDENLLCLCDSILNKVDKDNKNHLIEGLRWIGRIRTLKFLLRELSQYYKDKNLGYYFEKWRQNSALKIMNKILVIQKWIKPILLSLHKKRAERKNNLLKSTLQRKQKGIELNEILTLKRWNRKVKTDQLSPSVDIIHNFCKNILDKLLDKARKSKQLHPCQDANVEYEGIPTNKNSPELMAKYLENILREPIKERRKDAFNKLKSLPCKRELFRRIVQKRNFNLLKDVLGQAARQMKLIYLIKILEINKDFSLKRFVHEVIMIWKIYTKRVSKKRKNMKSMYEQMNVLYLKMANSLFGNDQPDNPSIQDSFQEITSKHLHVKPELEAEMEMKIALELEKIEKEHGHEEK